MEPGTQLTVAQRAQVALGAAEHEKKLTELVAHAQGVTAITNAVTYAECHGARMGLKNARVAIEKAGKAAREDATAYSKGVIAEEKRLKDIGAAEEQRLQTMQDAHDNRVKAEKEAKEKAEAERVERIKSRIEQDIRLPAQCMVGKGSVVIATVIEDVRAIPIDSWFAEFKDEAEQAKVRTITALMDMHVAAIAHEDEQRQIKVEREELARFKAEEDKRQREAAEREAEAIRKRAAEEAAAREKLETEARERRAKMDEEERIAWVAREKADRIAREKREAEAAELKAEQDRIDGERRKLEEQQREAREAREDQERIDRQRKEFAERQEREAKEAEEREARRLEAEQGEARAVLEMFVRRYGKLRQFKAIVKAINIYIDAENTTQAA